MGHFRVPRLVAILLLGAPLCGCATSQLPDGLSQLNLASRFGRPPAEPEPPSDHFNPFPPLNDAAEPSSKDDAAVRDAIQTVAHSIPSPPDASLDGPAASDPVPELAGHDPATRQLIEEELRDATPEERRVMIRDLQGVDPPMVRQILKIRRMVRRMGQSDGSTTGTQHPSVMAQDAPDPRNSGVPERRHAQADRSRRFDVASDQAPGKASVIPAAGHSLAGADSPPQTSPRPAPGKTTFPTPSPAAAWPQEPIRHSTVRTADLRAAAVGSPGASPAEQPGQWSPQDDGTAGNRSPVEEAASQYDDIPVIDATDYLVARQISGVPAANELRESAADGSTGRPAAAQSGAPPSRLGQNGSDGPTTWEQALHRAISEVEAEVAHLSPGSSPEERHEYVTRHVALRMLYFVAGEQERALQAVPYIEPADQEFWQQMFWAIANYFDSKGMPDSSDRATQTVTQLKLAVQRLQEKAQLQLRNVTFCHKISSYGNYERFNRDEFSPGQPVLLYAEVDNFKSEPTADGQYRTILKSTIEIYKAGPNGDLVYREPFAATEDLCRNYRRDYFHSYEFSIPQRIALGPHVLKLTVEDQLSRKLATYSLNFTVK